MKNIPILEFKNDAEVMECMKWWKNKLFLNDWIIKAKLVPREEIDGCAGKNNFIYQIQSSLIRIAIPNDDMRERIGKYCQESTLVHELLHCKYNWLECGDTYEGKYVETCEHVLLEQMAKSLIMVKYKLETEWFSNV